MSAPKDVLRRLDWYATVLGKVGSVGQAAEMKAIRDAVAELIDADTSYDLALGALEEFHRQTSEKGHRAARMFDARALVESFVRADEHRALVLLQFAPVGPGGAA